MARSSLLHTLLCLLLSASLASCFALNTTEAPLTTISTELLWLFNDSVTLPTSVIGTGESDSSGRQYELRLVGGKANNEGVLQVFMDGGWGWVLGSNDSYRSAVASVACQGLGFARSTKLRSSSGSALQAPWLMARLNCSGLEHRLVDCAHINYTTPVGEEEIATWDRVIISCSGELNRNSSQTVRLIGSNATSGWLQLSAPNGGWVDVCTSQRSTQMGHVICRELGLGYATFVGTPSFFTYFDRTTTDDVVYAVTCTGSERSIGECETKVGGASNCPDDEVGVQLTCSNVTMSPLGSEVRLTEGDWAQVKHNGAWHYIWSWWPVSLDALAICRQLGGQNMAEAWTEQKLGLMPVLPYAFECLGGHEQSLMECVQLNRTIQKGNVYPYPLRVQCSADPTPERGDLRLVNGPSPNKGRIEIYIDYRWGTICDDFWSQSSAASVACRQLGLGEVGISKENAYYDRGTGPIYLDDLRCDGTEARLLDCQHREVGMHNCLHNEDAGLECYPSHPTSTPGQAWKVELVGGPSSRSGTVQIYINGRQGTICDDNFDYNDGQVVCRMLGYPYVASVLPKSYFGVGSGEILLDDVRCVGTEATIENCWYIGVGIHNCGHSEDVGVTCTHEFGAGPVLATALPPMFPYPTANPGPTNLDMGIGSATILIAVLVVMCLGCMFCACVMRRLRVNSNIETVNNNTRNGANTYALVDQHERAAAAATSIPPSYTDVLSNPNEYTQVNDEPDGLPPQSPPPTSPPPSYNNAFVSPPSTLRVVTEQDPSSGGEGQVRREPIPIPLSPPPSYDDAAPVFPTAAADTSRSAQALPDVVTVLPDGDHSDASPESEQTNPDLESNREGSEHEREQGREHVL